MNELKPEYVVKALECCSTRNCDSCDYYCHYTADPYKIDCTTELTKHALALLREKEAEIERKRERIVDLKCEIERLTSNMNGYAFTAQTLSKEFEDYRADVQMEIASERTETIDEFSAKLEAKLIEKWFLPVIVKNAIEEVAKEMKGI